MHQSLRFRSFVSSFVLSICACGAPIDTHTATASSTSALELEADSSNAPPRRWDQLSSAQQTQILNDEQVRIDGPSNDYWEVAFYQWIKPLATNVDPEGAAAIYWDLPGQADYLSAYGLAAITVTGGEGTASEQIVAEYYVPTPAGPQPIFVPQINSALKLGQGRRVAYLLPSHTTDTAAYPGVFAVLSDVAFDHFPGDQGGALLTYRTQAFPYPSLLGNAEMKAGLSAQLGAVAQAHVQRMQQGPTQAQLRHLRAALR